MPNCTLCVTCFAAATGCEQATGEQGLWALIQATRALAFVLPLSRLTRTGSDKDRADRMERAGELRNADIAE